MKNERQTLIEGAFNDLKAFITPLQEKFEKTGTLSDKEAQILFIVRKATKTLDKAPEEVKPTPKPQVHYLEASAQDLLQRLEGVKDRMNEDQRHNYNVLRKIYDADRSGLSLPWETLDVLRSIYEKVF